MARRSLVADKMHASQEALIEEARKIKTKPQSPKVPFVSNENTDTVSNMYGTWLMFFDSWLRINSGKLVETCLGQVYDVLADNRFDDSTFLTCLVLACLVKDLAAALGDGSCENLSAVLPLT